MCVNSCQILICWLLHVAEHRQVCENCRCPRHDHDVTADDTSDAYDRLGVNVSSELQKWRQASRDLPAKLGYTWLPPGLGKQKVCCVAAPVGCCRGCRTCSLRQSPTSQARRRRAAPSANALGLITITNDQGRINR